MKQVTQWKFSLTSGAKLDLLCSVCSQYCDIDWRNKIGEDYQLRQLVQSVKSKALRPHRRKSQRHFLSRLGRRLLWNRQRFFALQFFRV